MRKLYPLIFMVCFVLTGNRLAAQCQVSISTNTNTTQLNCKNPSITLTVTPIIGSFPSYQWNTGQYGNSINVSIPGTYTVTGLSQNCQPSASITITKDFTIPNVRVLGPDTSICRGDTIPLIASGAASYMWQPGSLTGSVVSVSPASATTYTVTGTDVNGCIATDTIQIVVNQLPAALISGTDTVCQNAAPPLITFGGISGTPPFTFGYTINAGPLQTISTIGRPYNSISVVAPTATPGIFKYDLQSVTDRNGCIQIQHGTAEIAVVPRPSLTSIKTASVCNNIPFNYAATSSSTGTSFTWTRPAVAGIPNQAASGTTAIINETLNNTTSQPVVVTYFFTLFAGNGCIVTDSLKVTVNPTPVIAPVPDYTFCNKTFVNGGIGFASSSAGVSFIWRNSDTNIGLPASGTGSIPPFVANNITNSPVTATITVAGTVSADNCLGPSTTFRITVLPTPILTSTKTASVCNNAPFNYSATSSFTGTSFSWTRPAVAGVTNPAASGTTATINETLNNTTSRPVVVTYLFTLSAGTSCITTDSLKITINPTPVINPIRDTTFCNSIFVSGGIPFTSGSPGVSFSWTNSNLNIGLPASGTGNIFPFVANNITNSPVTATIIVSVKASADSCTGSSTSFRITVLPTPVFSSIKTASVCNNASFNYAAKSSFTGTSFSWIRPAVAGITNPAASGTSAIINDTLHNTTSQPVVVTYLYTLYAGTGCIVTDSLRVTVNPTPVINPIRDTTFCNRTFVNRGILFTSSYPGTSFSWTNSTPSIGLPASGTGSIPPFVANNNTTNIPVIATITVYAFIEAGTDSCRGSSTSFRVTVFPGPVLTGAKTVSVCNNAPFTYVASSSFTGTSFRWTRDFVAGIRNPVASGTSATVDDTLNNTTAQPVVVTYLFTLSAGTGCIVTDSLKVTVNPTPVINPVSDYTFCNKTFVNGSILFTSSYPGTSFSWTNSDTSIGLPAGGTGNNLSFVANNNTTDIPVTATITVYAFIKAGTDSCRGSSTTFKVTVLPGPVLTSDKTASICNNTPFNYAATSSFTGTSFTWRRDAVAGINNPAANGTSGTLNDTLHNTTGQPIVVTYLYTLYAGTGCIVTDFLRVTVNPTPVVNPVPDYAFCNRDFVNGGIPFTSSYPGTSFSWTNSNPNIGLPASGTGNNLSFVANNNATDSSVTAIITVYAFIKAGNDSCQGSSTTFKVTVLPGPVLTGAKTASVCNNAPFHYAAASSFTGTNFTWRRDAVAGIRNPATGGTSATVNDTLNNTTSEPVVITYLFTLSAGTSCIVTDSLKVTVNPTPVINPIRDTTFCNRDFVNVGVPFTSSSPGASFSWTNSNPNIGLQVNGTGNIRPFIANNTTNSPITATIIVSAFIKAGADSCPGSSTTFRITVFPTPILTSLKTTSVCNNAPFSYTATSFATGTNFSWTRDVVAGVTNLADSGTTATINETLNNPTSQPVVVTYLFTLSTGTACVTTDSVLVTVNPTPVIKLLNKSASVCNGVPFSDTAKSLTTVTGFTWIRPAVPGISNTTGNGTTAFINDTLNNTTSQPVVVTYFFTLSASTGCTTTDSLKVTVNPTAVINRVPDITVCNGTLLQGIEFLSNSSPGVSFKWKNSNPGIGLSDSGIGNIPPFIINHTAGTPDIAVIRVYPTIISANCPGRSDSFNIIVKPSPSRPGFTSLFRYPDSDPLNVCQGSENINFNVNIPDKALTYNWTTNVGSNTEVNIKNTHDTNTVVTFSTTGRYTIYLIASSSATGCSSSASQIVQVAAGTPGIAKQQIFPLNNNLLFYGDNSLERYQWGYDTVYSPLPNYSYGRPVPVQGQVYQYFIPSRKFIDSVNHTLDLSRYTYWVLLQDHGCSTRFYYNGFYANRVISNTPVSDTVKLKIIPNPNKGIFDISLEGNIYGNINAQIEDAMGQVVFSKNFIKMIPAVREKINAPNLPGGVYFLILHSSDLKTVTSRFVIQR